MADHGQGQRVDPYRAGGSFPVLQSTPGPRERKEEAVGGFGRHVGHRKNPRGVVCQAVG